MKILLSLCLLWSLVCLAVTIDAPWPAEDDELLQTQNKDPCTNILCHAGQECSIVGRNAACICKKSCPESENTVCGSNGITFPNHCELHRTACLEGKKISIKHDGTCKGQPTHPPPSAKVNKSKPVVCYEHDRDEIRSRLIGWLQRQDTSLKGVEGYKNLLKFFFDLVDENKDGKLDATEFREFVAANQSADEVASMEEYTNPILQKLCADALISISDEDSDGELSFHEFMKCLSPEFKPTKKDCELDNEAYEDGSEIPTSDCNTCVCACGQWVCTTLKCDGTEGNLASAETSEDEEEGQKFIVNGEEAQEQLTRGVIQREEKLIHQHQRKVLPLFKPRQHQKYRKHGKHGSRARNFRDE